MNIKHATQYLGALCKKAHDFNDTGESVRKKSDGACLQCCSESAKARYSKNILLARQKARDRVHKKAEQYRLLNTERKKKSREQNIEEHRAYAREYYKKNALREKLRIRVNYALRQQKIEKCKTFKKYGLDAEAILKFLGPCPGDIKDYEIDHIIPLSSFNFADESQVKDAFAPENHQWLTKQQNMEKHNKLNWTLTK